MKKISSTNESLKKSKSLYEMFRDLMDQIYFSGYTDEVLSKDQELYTFEWNSFVAQHS
jgi:hypothetical protein